MYRNILESVILSEAKDPSADQVFRAAPSSQPAIDFQFARVEDAPHHAMLFCDYRRNKKKTK
jgi:hypothetical protein